MQVTETGQIVVLGGLTETGRAVGFNASEIGRATAFLEAVAAAAQLFLVSPTDFLIPSDSEICASGDQQLFSVVG
jgi:hypothetical protein